MPVAARTLHELRRPLHGPSFHFNCTCYIAN